MSPVENQWPPPLEEIATDMLDPQFSAYLVRKFGSPLYYYDAAQIDARFKELRSVLPTGSRLLYSLKANPMPDVCSVLKDCGCEAEVSSTGELSIAENVGFDLARALYTGPGKSKQDIEHVVQSKVGTVSCESETDLKRVLALRPRGDTLIRINPGAITGAGLAMGGAGRQFGFTRESVRTTNFEQYSAVVGFHIYSGTQLSAQQTLSAAFENAYRLISELAHRLPQANVFDLGGGFPWPFARTEPPPDIHSLASTLAELRARAAPGADFWFESGRYLCASSGTLIATVLDVKQDEDGVEQVILDTGINHLGGMSGLRRTPSPTLSFSLSQAGEAHRASESTGNKYDVFGPLCTPLDSLARGVTLETLPAPGDLVQVPNVGAYGLSASLLRFLNHPAPVEILGTGERILAAKRLHSRYESFSPNI